MVFARMLWQCAPLYSGVVVAIFCLGGVIWMVISMEWIMKPTFGLLVSTIQITLETENSEQTKVTETTTIRKMPSVSASFRTAAPRSFGGFSFTFFYLMFSQQKLLEDLFQAYYDARRNKRNTSSALKFEMNYESNILQLGEELLSWKYVIGKSVCFIINDPVKREIFAADFRDRIVHHLVYNYIYQIFDNHFINDSYSCRVGKGTHYGIKRVDHFIRSCSGNYCQDSWILKLDVKGFFMSIDKQILRQITSDFLTKYLFKLSCDLEFLLPLLHQLIFHDPTKHYHFQWNKSDYLWLPDDKSLFHSWPYIGLPIGNLTSQLFANIYLDKLDKFIKYQLGVKYYGRYVDDFVLIHTDKQFLLSLIPQIKLFLQQELKLTLHPKKIYLQHYTKWVKFLGAFIKPHRIYMHKRTIWNFYHKIQTLNKTLENSHPLSEEHKSLICSTTNSYLGFLRHYKWHKITKKLFKHFHNTFHNHFSLTKWLLKLKPTIRKLKKSEYKNLYRIGNNYGNLR